MRLIAVAALVAASPAFADIEVFSMPSGNIECSVGTDVGYSDIQCVIFERSGAPAAPRPPGCDGAWGHRFAMQDRGPVSLECGAPGRPVGGGVFAYGRSAGANTGITCQSSTAGLECRNRDGHGFFLSRARQTRY